jgi:hypothetical protein
MNARNKLNRAALTGCLAVAGILGGITDSWSVFGICLVLGIALAAQSGEIRIAKNEHRRG